MRKDDTANARAAASRRNGARSQGPRTAAGRARSRANWSSASRPPPVGRGAATGPRRRSRAAVSAPAPRPRSCRRSGARPNEPEKARQNKTLACERSLDRGHQASGRIEDSAGQGCDDRGSAFRSAGTAADGEEGMPFEHGQRQPAASSGQSCLAGPSAEPRFPEGGGCWSGSRRENLRMTAASVARFRAARAGPAISGSRCRRRAGRRLRSPARRADASRHRRC